MDDIPKSGIVLAPAHFARTPARGGHMERTVYTKTTHHAFRNRADTSNNPRYNMRKENLTSQKIKYRKQLLTLLSVRRFW